MSSSNIPTRRVTRAAVQATSEGLAKAIEALRLALESTNSATRDLIQAWRKLLDVFRNYQAEQSATLDAVPPFAVWARENFGDGDLVTVLSKVYASVLADTRLDSRVRFVRTRLGLSRELLFLYFGNTALISEVAIRGVAMCLRALPPKSQTPSLNDDIYPAILLVRRQRLVKALRGNYTAVTDPAIFIDGTSLAFKPSDLVEGTLAGQFLSCPALFLCPFLPISHIYCPCFSLSSIIPIPPFFPVFYSFYPPFFTPSSQVFASVFAPHSFQP